MKRILITPLDWGLGHATRCIPVIREFERHGCEVLIAGSGDALALLRRELPDHRFFSLPGYAPRYPSNGSMTLSMAKQVPHFISVIRREHRALESLVASESVDLVISDNRYGCWSRRVPSVLITHQSNVLMPKRFGLLQGVVRNAAARFINRFDRCWIPDFPAGDSLAGALISFGEFSFRTPTDFVGWLSRFERGEQPPETSLDVLAILSGPEPQRSTFENALVPQLVSSSLAFRLVRGLASDGEEPEDTRIVNVMTSADLQELIASAAIVVARSGYSTVMDMQALGKKAIFVPTPGQTEQEYIADSLMERGVAFSMRQRDLDLSLALIESTKYSGFTLAGKNRLLGEAVKLALAM